MKLWRTGIWSKQVVQIDLACPNPRAPELPALMLTGCDLILKV